ncbi:hypothetical protein CVT24_008459 [Panaeolus cyanescens]|uniref:Protein kinase domain-containing protein n=1 Tax=Panaeolus cyanescens TaxID=181874 RepID=A0A409VEX3_9AGAR|nr:hypothetical protein CVT24_008459 [Panaeolus cyanescens]
MTSITKIGTPSISISEDGFITQGRIGLDTSARTFTELKVLGTGDFSTVSLCDWHSPDLLANIPLSDMEIEPTRRPVISGMTFGRLVAVKRIRHSYAATEADGALAIATVKVPQVLPPHPNIIMQHDAFLDVSSPDDCNVYVVLEPMEGNLYHLTKVRRGKTFAAGLMMSMFHQLASAIDHVHSHGYFHRDLKPENILVTTTGLKDYSLPWPGSPRADAGVKRDITVKLKLTDFGLARERGSPGPYTQYVSTRWYRAPEILLLSKHYTLSVDYWSLGAILAELVNLAPLFPGASTIDQIERIVQKLGSPVDGVIDDDGQLVDGGSWSEGLALAADLGFRFPTVTAMRFSSFFDPDISPLFIDCIRGLLAWNPAQRFTAKMCLEHEFLLDFQKQEAELQS